MFMASTTPALSMQAACIITIPFFVCLKLTEQDVFDAYREEVSNHVFKSFKSFALAKKIWLSTAFIFQMRMGEKDFLQKRKHPCITKQHRTFFMHRTFFREFGRHNL